MLSSLKSWVFGPDYQSDDDESINDEDVLEIACETETKILDGKISHLMEDFGLVGKMSLLFVFTAVVSCDTTFFKAMIFETCLSTFTY